MVNFKNKIIPALYVIVTALTVASAQAHVVINQKVVGKTTLQIKSPDDYSITCDLYYPVDDSTEGQVASNGLWILGNEAVDGTPAEAEQKRPLIMLSPGWATSSRHNAWLAHYLAKRGYLVAIVEHYGCSGAHNLVEYAFGNLWVRPRDIRHTLDKLLAHEKWSKHIDKEKIGLAGFSLGAMTGLWMIGTRFDAEKMKRGFIQIAKWFSAPASGIEALQKQDWSKMEEDQTDKRFKAAFLMGPAFYDNSDKESLKKVETPVYLVAGSEDLMTPKSQVTGYASEIKNAEHTIIDEAGATHMMFINQCTPMGKAFSKQFCHKDQNRTSQHEQIGKLAAEFFDKHLK